MRAYIAKGWKVYPVNPKYGEIEGLECFPTLLDLPETPDFASLYVAPAVGIIVLNEIATKGIKKVYVNPGAESDALIAKAKRLGLQPLMVCSIRTIGEDPDKL